MTLSQNFESRSDMPLDLQLDLLVDEELPEQDRRALLKSLDSDPARWRELSIRFLERQVEKKSVHQMIVGDVVDPAACGESAAVSPYKFPAPAVSHFARYASIAAGLLIAVTSAVVTAYFLRPGPIVIPGDSPLVKANQSEVITTPLPGSMWDTDGVMDVKVPVRNVSVKADSDTSDLFTNNSANQNSPRRSVVIKSDGGHNALIIPVTNLQFQ